MNKEERAQIREQNRIKNQRRRDAKRKSTVYAQAAAKARKEISTGGAFGAAEPELFNRLAEGTSAVRRAETTQAELERHALTGD